MREHPEPVGIDCVDYEIGNNGRRGSLVDRASDVVAGDRRTGIDLRTVAVLGRPVAVGIEDAGPYPAGS